MIMVEAINKFLYDGDTIRDNEKYEIIHTIEISQCDAKQFIGKEIKELAQSSLGTPELADKSFGMIPLPVITDRKRSWSYVGKASEKKIGELYRNYLIDEA